MNEKCLIVKLSALGDVIAALPFASWIQSHFQTAQIDWVVEKSIAPLIRASDAIAKPIVADTKGWRQRGCPIAEWRSFFKELRQTDYDYVIDLQGNIKSGLITAGARGRVKAGLGFKDAAEWPSALALNRRVPLDKTQTLTKQYEEIFARIFDAEPRKTELVLRCKTPCDLRGDGPFFMVCPGSNWQNKQLTEPCWLDFLSRVAHVYQPTYFFIWGSETERALCERLASHFPGAQIYGRLDFGFWQELMRAMQVVIGVDSSSLHLCGTTQTPSFAFFGPSHGRVYNPIGEKRGFYQGSCPYNLRFTMRCPQLRTCATGACLREVSGETLFKAFDQWALTASIKRSKSTCC